MKETGRGIHRSVGDLHRIRSAARQVVHGGNTVRLNAVYVRPPSASTIGSAAPAGDNGTLMSASAPEALLSQIPLDLVYRFATAVVRSAVRLMLPKFPNSRVTGVS